MANNYFKARNGLIVDAGFVANGIQVSLGSNVILSTSSVKIGNSTVNSTSNSTFFNVANSTSQANLTPLQLVIGSSIVNSTALAAGANVILSTTSLSVGNATINVFANSSLLSFNQIANLSAIGLTVGNVAVLTGYVSLGNSTINNVINSTSIALGNSTVVSTLLSTSLTVGNVSSLNTTSLNVGGVSTLNTTALLVGANTTTHGTAFYILTGGNTGFSNSTPATKVQIDGNFGYSQTTISTSNNINVNCALSNFFNITCNGSAANIYFTNAPSGTVYGMVLRIANGGTNTISWANTPKWPSATAPSASTNTDVWIFFTTDAGSTWRGNQVQKDSR